MTKEFENLKKELAEAGSENDVLAALDGYTAELSDEEVISIVGGIALKNTNEVYIPNCPGKITKDCIGKCVNALDEGDHFYAYYVCAYNNSRIGWYVTE